MCIIIYCIAGNIGIWRIGGFLVTPPILNQPILRQLPEKAWQSYRNRQIYIRQLLYSNPPNIIPANISGYTVRQRPRKTVSITNIDFTVSYTQTQLKSTDRYKWEVEETQYEDLCTHYYRKHHSVDRIQQHK